MEMIQTMQTMRTKAKGTLPAGSSAALFARSFARSFALSLALSMALLLALGRAAHAAPPPLVESRCAASNLVDAEFRDAALAALDRLVVRAPGQAADGAVRNHHSAGHIDSQGHAWHQVSAYQVNLGLVGALRVSTQLLPTVERWLTWQARHITPVGTRRGVVLDHWLRVDSGEESTCPPGIEARLCQHVDAYDSTAASTLLMADAYLRHGGQVAVLRDPVMRATLEAAANMLRELTTAEGLTLALPEHRVAYTMDAVEVIAGWRAWSRVQRDAYAEPTAADNTVALAERAEVALQTRLWDRVHNSWRVSADGDPPQRGRWYPDTMAQAWPLLWGGASSALARDIQTWRRAIAPWQNKATHWADRVADPAGFLWPAAAVAAQCSGDKPTAKRWIERVRLRWLDPKELFAWPFQVGDLLWLLWMAEPSVRPSALRAFPPPTPG
jgi:hypothetical protein